MPPLDIVTGAFGYSGQYVARRLLNAGRAVRTITNSLRRDSPLQGKIEAVPYSFDRPDDLREALRGADTLYNTYWVRFNEGNGHARAVENSRILFRCAREAGIRRIVHTSITNPSADSYLTYFRGKARVEEALRECGVSYAILRPAVLFGKEDILINNIAWVLRRFPFFPMFGRGEYGLQPIYVDDLARLAVQQGAEQENVVINAIGPETFSYRDMVEMIARETGVGRWVVPMPRYVTLLGGWAIGRMLGDVLTTRQEMLGLMDNLLVVPHAPPAGTTALSEWVRTNRDVLGKHYSSELARRRNREKGYENL